MRGAAAACAVVALAGSVLLLWRSLRSDVIPGAPRPAAANSPQAAAEVHETTARRDAAGAAPAVHDQPVAQFAVRVTVVDGATQQPVADADTANTAIAVPVGEAPRPLHFFVRRGDRTRELMEFQPATVVTGQGEVTVQFAPNELGRAVHELQR